MNQVFQGSFFDKYVLDGNFMAMAKKKIIGVFIGVSLLLVYVFKAYAQSTPVVSSEPMSEVWINLSEKEFKSKISSFARKGYAPVDFEVITGTESRTYALVMKKLTKKRKSIVRTQLEEGEFKDTWRELLRKGYRPIDVESYSFESRPYMGAIWIKDRSVSWVSYESLDVKAFDLVTEEARSNTKIPIDINAYIRNSRVKFTAIYAENIEGHEWLLERGLDYEGFESYTQNMYQKGYSLIDTTLYTNKNGIVYAAVWKEDGKEWKIFDNLDETGLNEVIALNNPNGYFVHDIEVKRTREGLRYTALLTEVPVIEAKSKGAFKLF